MDLLVRIWSPGSVVELGDVVDDVLDAADDDLARGVSEVHDVVKSCEDVLLEHLSVFGTNRRVLPLLRVLRSRILLVLS